MLSGDFLYDLKGYYVCINTCHKHLGLQVVVFSLADCHYEMIEDKILIAVMFVQVSIKLSSLCPDVLPGIK